MFTFSQKNPKISFELIRPPSLILWQPCHGLQKANAISSLLDKPHSFVTEKEDLFAANSTGVA